MGKIIVNVVMVILVSHIIGILRDVKMVYIVLVSSTSYP